MTGKIENTPGMINDNTGMINDNTGMINDNTGMIEESAGLKIDRTGLKNDANNTEYTANGRKKRSRERGKDSKPRNFPLHTMKNLPQFRDKPHEEVREYILQTKGVDIGSNINFGSLILWVFVVLAIVAGGYGVYKIIKRLRKRREAPAGIEMQYD